MAGRDGTGVSPLAAMTWFVPEDPMGPDRLRDPDDDAVVAAARYASATVIVTGDRDILEAEVAGIEVLPPAAFVARLDSAAGGGRSDPRADVAPRRSR